MTNFLFGLMEQNCKWYNGFLFKKWIAEGQYGHVKFATVESSIVVQCHATTVLPDLLQMLIHLR